MTDQDSELQVTSTSESPTRHAVEVQVPASRVTQAFERAYRELAGQVKVRGFRPGKTPRSVLERLYGPGVAEQLEQTLVAETLSDAVEQVGLEPVAEPSVESPTPAVGEAFRYTVRIEVKPEIELPDLAGLAATRPRVDVANVGEDA